MVLTKIERDKKKKIKRAKSQRKAELRKRTLGIGITENNNNKGNKKIRFDDGSDDDDNAFVVSRDDSNQCDMDNKLDLAPVKVNASDDDSDGPVEMISGSIAKQEAMELRESERKTRSEEKNIIQKRKRKKVEDLVPASIESDDEIDDNFLAEVDSERGKEAKLRKMKKARAQDVQLGRHTTFVSEDDGPNSLQSIPAKHNIEVVVLPPTNFGADDAENSDNGADDVASNRWALRCSSRLGTKPSDAALAFCKSNLIHRSSNKEMKDQTWKRSRTMKYTFKNGKAAVSFLVKK